MVNSEEMNQLSKNYEKQKEHNKYIRQDFQETLSLIQLLLLTVSFLNILKCLTFTTNWKTYKQASCTDRKWNNFWNGLLSMCHAKMEPEA